MKEVFLLRFQSDTVEGRGHTYTEAIFTKECDAKRAGNNSNHTYMGGQPAWEVDRAVVHESYDEYHNLKNGKLKEQALAKLSPAERKALGF